ncbi:MAG: hypothetical protein FWG64_08275, partial [Firmicutes bacterium]|nr:hypothetical protein [Bacillota bacterium]
TNCKTVGLCPTPRKDARALPPAGRAGDPHFLLNNAKSTVEKLHLIKSVGADNIRPQAITGGYYLPARKRVRHYGKHQTLTADWRN